MAEPSEAQLARLRELGARYHEGHVLRRNPDSVTVVQWGQSAPSAVFPIDDNNNVADAFRSAIALATKHAAELAAAELAAAELAAAEQADLDQLLAEASKTAGSAVTEQADGGSKSKQSKRNEGNS